jgi:hypothetical protein
MTTEQAVKEVKECAMYLAMFENEEGNEELKAALHAKWLEAKRVLEAAGVIAV